MTIGKAILTSQKSNTRKRFNQLKDKWLKNTRVLSDPQKVAEDDNYKTIIESKYEFVDCMLDDFRMANYNQWFIALGEILQLQPPVEREHQGRFELIAESWLKWANDNIPYQTRPYYMVVEANNGRTRYRFQKLLWLADGKKEKALHYLEHYNSTDYYIGVVDWHKLGSPFKFGEWYSKYAMLELL